MECQEIGVIIAVSAIVILTVAVISFHLGFMSNLSEPWDDDDDYHGY